MPSYRLLDFRAVELHESIQDAHPFLFLGEGELHYYIFHCTK